MSGHPYNDEFIARCREAAVQYDRGDKFFRLERLAQLWIAVPRHFRDRVFAGIAFYL